MIKIRSIDVGHSSIVMTFFFLLLGSLVLKMSFFISNNNIITMIFLIIEAIGDSSIILPKQWQFSSSLNKALYMRKIVKTTMTDIVVTQVILLYVLSIRRIPSSNSPAISNRDNNVVVKKLRILNL